MGKKKNYLITNACILCKKCENNCPKNAISFDKEGFKCTINQELCISCGICYRGCVYRAIEES